MFSTHQFRKFQFLGHKDCVYTLAEGPESGTFFSAGGDGMVVLWDIQNPEFGKPIVKVSGTVYCLFYLQKANELLVASNRVGLHLIDLESKKEVWSFPTPENQWFRMVKVNGKIWVSGSAGKLMIFDFQTRLVETLEFGNHDLRALDVSENKTKLALGNSNGDIFILNLVSGEKSSMLKAHQTTVFGLQFYPGSNHLASCGKDARLKLWIEKENGAYEISKEVPAHLFAIHDVELHPSNPYLATASTDKTIKIWNAETLKLLLVLDKSRHAGHGHSINQLLWLKESELLLSCSDDRTISAWDIFV